MPLLADCGGGLIIYHWRFSTVTSLALKRCDNYFKLEFDTEEPFFENNFFYELFNMYIILDFPVKGFKGTFFPAG